MKNVQIKRLSLFNFKGIKHFAVDFNGETRIYGDNATGKTTLVDAFSWLLFGKNSNDKKDFSIKPFGQNNEVLHHLDSVVEGTFDVDGEAITLKKTFREKWTTKRGEKEAQLTGHETIFEWNDVPMKAGEYQRKVDEIILESTFKMISSPFYFNSLKWQERRRILTEIAGNVDDNEIAATNPTFEALFNEKGKKTIEELRKELAAKKKKLKDELKLIPARIDELARNTPEAKDWAWIENEIESVNKNIEIIEGELADKSQVSGNYYKAVQDRQAKINNLKTKISDFEFEGNKEFLRNLNEKSESIKACEREISKINGRIKEDAEEIDRLKRRINLYGKEQQELRNAWTAENEKEFPGIDENMTYCPTCKQQLPANEIESKRAAMRNNFNTSKQKRLAEISEEGKAINPVVEGLANKIKVLQNNDYQVQIAEHERVMNEWENKHLQSVQAILSGNVEYQNAKQELASFEAQPEIEKPQLDDNLSLKSKKNELQGSLYGLKKDLGLKDQIKASAKRKEELFEQEKTYSNELAGLEQTEFTIDEFTRAKVDMLEGKINALFDGAVNFRMFDTQLNGGLVECCDTIIEGVPWADANNAAKINAGIAIINVLTDHFKQLAPIWIDNAESITNIGHTDSQRIELYVSEAHKSLEIAS